MQTQATINVASEDSPTSAPEPDVFVLNKSIEHFPVEYPGPADLALVTEVADTTLGFDLSTKAALYARAAIVEYWVLDVIHRVLILHRDPQKGRYQFVLRYSESETVTCLAATDAPVPVARLLPPAPPAETAITVDRKP